MIPFSKILIKDNFTREDIIRLLTSENEDRSALFARSAKVKEENVGNVVYFRGLIEFSNICGKNCLYCGIRKGNKNANRYNLTDDEILEAARFAFESNYGSVVLQGGELEGEAFTLRIERLLHRIKELSDGRLGITLSVGEQTREVYRRWFEAGAHRYLLRIESSDRELYYRIHPSDKKHSFERRLQALYDLRDTGYQVGTGVMIGLPFQTPDHLAGDLLFMKAIDIDMCGMGPYIEHADTPLWAYRDQLLPLEARFDLALKMIAVLRLMMKNINIASATALQAIDPIGREKALKIGANIIMPNITPGVYRDDYKLYENKPCTDEEAADCKNCLEARIHMSGNKIGYDQWGDSIHFRERN
ncbi:MAG: [FeFe] hydrogenase H-cluster radical SAM maturase HydE [Lentimicrobium sp.]|uniref:[FeFe] hydrogenase H-cluster radical SAM maturase HydE n=1 Tax=Lentimicrobium sp. TaxID=2034841 RepID=UPI0025D6904D|nr:[FeFe] hydrogenase H-cluster radical SAM maturase HydE [Lentimicrobium sp.]MCO5256217.1 [FeFe] hydrogenase H-cluster radical SAM maturase HydE [Lentimicrobium sp.]HPF64969.1 [FeFe] hydrogenase H-cluster radical SAM maturase HydE [Lentimicrobium sp.]HPJ63102.1 [FeFe] hydrogenase H-cluster radical SAM maturase HydE [Lentimicrobium sp.]